jgi:type I restriction enzyme, S subunit
MYQVPVGWAKVKIAEVTLPVEKVEPSPDEEFTYLDISSIDNVLNRITEPKIYYGKDAPSRARQRVKAGDVLFSTVRTYLKNIASVPAAYDNQIASTGFSVLRGALGINSQYLFYYTLTEPFLSALAELQRGTSYPAVRDGDVREQLIPIAPSAEQRRIVEAIETHFTRLDAAVAALKRVQANLRRYRASVLKAACEGRLVPTEAELARAEGREYEPASVLLERILAERRAKWERENLGRKYFEPVSPDATALPKLPEGWCWVSAQQVCEFITKGTTPAAEKLSAGTGQIPFIKVYNLTFDGALDFQFNPTFVSNVTHKQELARSIVMPGDVLMNIVGPPLGKVSIVPDTFAEWNINQAIARFRVLPGCDNTYLGYCLLSEAVLDWAIRRAKATAGQFNLTLEICRELPIPFPPAAEQARIIDEVERRLSTVKELQKTVEVNTQRAERLRQSILQRAFAGQLVPQDPSDEPASVLLERIKAARNGQQQQAQLL